MKRRIFYNSLLIAVSIFAALIVAEVAYRGYVFIKKPLHKPSSYPNVHWELTPGAYRAEENIEGVPVEYYVNSAGFRDYSNEKWNEWGPDDIKVAFVGDSVVYGAGVDHASTFASLVQSMFINADIPLISVNLGIGGFNTLQELGVIKHKAFPFRPDIIVLGYFMNDINITRTERLPNVIKFMMRKYHFGTYVLKRIGRKISDMRFLRSKSGTMKNNMKRKTVDVCSGYAHSIIQEYQTSAWEGVKKHIRTMKELCLREGIVFAIVVFPFKDQIDGRCSDVPHELLTVYLDEIGVPYLDLRENFKLQRDEKLYLEGDNIHLNDRGHYITALAIRRWLDSDTAFSKLFKKTEKDNL